MRRFADNFLQANEIGIFALDDIHHPVQQIAAISPADPFMDIIAQ
jgi:hypothetical protein